MTQLALLKLPSLLTPRQQTVLDALRQAGADGLEPSEAGAAWHSVFESRWRHSPDTRCKFCGKHGLDILHTLRSKGLARYRAKLKVWVACGVEEPADPPTREPVWPEHGAFPPGYGETP